MQPNYATYLRPKLLVPRLLVITVLTLVSGCSAPTVLTAFRLLDGYSAKRNPVTAHQPQPLISELRDHVLPDSFLHEGKPLDTQSFLRKTGTAGLVVVQDGKIIHEEYHYGHSYDSLFTSWSVAKSITSALIGIAIDEGFIASVTDPVATYVPELGTTAYADATIEDILEMASGVDFDENYVLGSDVANLQLAIANSLKHEVLKYNQLANTPGTFNAYKSLDTQVLGLVLTNATGQSVASYLESRIWTPAGMTHSGFWLADKEGIEATFFFFLATTRDFAKFGLIYLNQGFYNGQQIVPKQWISASLDHSKPHLQPGENPLSDDTWGYGFQWWFRDEGHDYAAVGIFNQFIYIDPERRLVIAKNSANPFYLLKDEENEHYALFRAIGRHLDSLNEQHK